MSKEISIVIADDHKVFAEGLAGLLTQHAGISDVRIAENSEVLQHIFTESVPDIAFIDIEYGTTDGREEAAQLKTEYPRCKYIALSSHSEPTVIKSSLKGAFDGYVLKTDSLDTIVGGIDKVLAGETFISPDSSHVLLDDVAGKKSKSFLPKLTSREKEVLDCIAREMSTKEIARHLFISDKTVEVHRSNLMLKMDAKNAAGLIRKAFETGLLN